VQLLYHKLSVHNGNYGSILMQLSWVL